MYFRSFKDFFRELVLIFEEGRFFYSVKYCLWVIVDRVKGVDFIKNEGYRKTGTDSGRASVYQATRDISYLKKILQKMKITQEDAILDLGCGKGYMLKIFYQYPFRKVGGVEVSKHLYDIALNNILKLGMSKCEIYCKDAVDFDSYDEYTYFYMFNPFPAVVMKEVIKNMEESLRRKKRKVIIIYKGPACHNIIVEDGVFELSETAKGKTLPYNVYTSII